MEPSLADSRLDHFSKYIYDACIVKHTIIVMTLGLLAACSGVPIEPPQQPQPVPNPPAQAQPTLPDGSPVLPASLYILGGLNNDVFLGCLSCPPGDPNSVHSQYGLYGGEYSVDSIFNNYGQYGSPYSVYSACNPYTQTPPVVIDGAGNYYGRLTVNRNHPEAISSQYDWLMTVVCI